MTQAEMLGLCSTDNLPDDLAKLDEALASCVILRDTYDKCLTDRQRLCGKAAVTYADEGNWEASMYKLRCAVENGRQRAEADDISRPLTTNEVIYFGLVVTALCAVWKRQNHKPKVTIKQSVETTKVVDYEENVVKIKYDDNEMIYHIDDVVPENYREQRLIRDDMFCYYIPLDYSCENLIAVPIKEGD